LGKVKEYDEANSNNNKNTKCPKSKAVNNDRTGFHVLTRASF